MANWLRDLDRILRGDATHPAALREETIDVPAGGIAVVVLALAVVYGLCMGCYAVFRPDGPCYWQLLASAVKVPLLFFLTLVVTFPSLYVFNALVGSRLGLVAVFRLLVAALGVNLAVLASLGPIVAFFSLSTTSYPFMVLLNVVVFAVSGFLGLAFLLQTLHRMTVAPRQARPPAPSTAPAPPPLPFSPTEQPGAELVEAKVVEEPGALDRMAGYVLGRQVKVVFNCWVVIFGLVGAQMGWVLRPFIGAPGAEFEWFRERQSNFFEAVLHTVRSLFS
jgi:hypothetical protein